MKRISIIGLCFAAVLVVSAMGVSSASALPQFYHCDKTNAGELTKGYATVAACEKLEGTGTAIWWAEVTEPVAIAGGGAGGKLIAESLPTVTCTGTKLTKGELSAGMLISKVVIEYTGCTATVLGVKVGCGTAEKITTKSLMGTLGYTSATEKDSKHVGVMFEPEISGETFATFSCSSQKNEVTGHVIGLIPSTQINVMLKEFEVRFECEPAGSSSQKHKSFVLLSVGLVENLDLKNNGIHLACVEGTGTVTTVGEKLVEVMA